MELRGRSFSKLSEQSEATVICQGRQRSVIGSPVDPCFQWKRRQRRSLLPMEAAVEVFHTLGDNQYGYHHKNGGTPKTVIRKRHHKSSFCVRLYYLTFDTGGSAPLYIRQGTVQFV